MTDKNGRVIVQRLNDGNSRTVLSRASSPSTDRGSLDFHECWRMTIMFVSSLYCWRFTERADGGRALYHICMHYMHSSSSSSWLDPIGIWDTPLERTYTQYTITHYTWTHIQYMAAVRAGIGYGDFWLTFHMQFRYRGSIEYHDTWDSIVYPGSNFRYCTTLLRGAAARSWRRE